MSDYDHIVVGAGSAGCVLAGRLSEDPSVRVLLLEAGPTDKKLEVRLPAAFPKLFKSERDWDYATEPEAELAARELYWPRGKMLGGSSSINAQMYVRGNPLDYDGWADLGNDGWSWTDVLPYFRRSEHFGRGADRWHGASGPLYVEDQRDPSPLTRAAIAAAIEAGIPAVDDINGPTQEGVTLTTVTQHRGRRWSASDAFLHPARQRANLTVVTGAHTTRVVMEGTRAVGVEYVVDGTTEQAAGHEVILSAGAINSPQILMLSGIGPADALSGQGIEVVVDCPGVGQDLQDHLAVPTIYTAGGSSTLLDAEKPQQLLKYFALRKGMLTSNVGEAMAFIRSRDGLPAPDVQLIMAPVEYINHGLEPPPGHGMTIGVVGLHPASRGAITLRSPDPFEAPAISARYLSEADDALPLVEGVKVARRISSQPSLKEVIDGEMWPGDGVVTDAEILDFVRTEAFTLYHPVGTCRMGPAGDRSAVVDPSLRVQGTEGLRVVDASVMPVIPRGNTNAPTIMVAEKAVDLIRAAAAPD